MKHNLSFLLLLVVLLLVLLLFGRMYNSNKRYQNEKQKPKKRKGRLQPGMDADIAVFDPDVVAPVGTYAEPYHAAVGVKHVLVMGTPVVRDGELLLDAAPGQPIRR